jgi:hypothetical protein
LRRTVMRTGAGLAVVAVAALLLFVGLGFCLWAGFQALTAHIGAVNAALSVGVVMLFLAGVMIWTAIRFTR